MPPPLESDRLPVISYKWHNWNHLHNCDTEPDAGIINLNGLSTGIGANVGHDCLC